MKNEKNGMTAAEKMKERTTLSFEVFPPKTEAGTEALKKALGEMNAFAPAWISCTCGASGSDKGCQNEILEAIGALNGPLPSAHYTCIHREKEQIREDTEKLLSMGVDHMLALRGDFRKGECATMGQFSHATELMEYLKELYGERLHLSCAGFPEGHIQSDDRRDDIAYLRRKQDLGAEYIVTQLTFDLEAFRRWLGELDRARITLPVSAGVMPVTERDKLLRHCLSQNGCAIPSSLARLISRFYDDPAGFREAGLDYTAAQIREYIALGVNDLHIYTLNDPAVTREVLERSGCFTAR